MRGILVAVVLGISLNTYGSGFDMEVAKKRCGSDNDQSKVLYSDDLKWGVTRQEMAEKFKTVYNSGKRLSLHSTYDKSEDQFHIYYKSGDGPKKVKINSQFIKSVTQQIENSLEEGYAEFIFFTDMGHSHLYFPEKHWKQTYKNWPPFVDNDRPKLYEKMLADPKMRPLYHTCEQLHMLDKDKKVIDDEYIKFRHAHRNVLGKNDGSGDIDIEQEEDDAANTVSSIDGMHLYSAGFSISASKEGCFPYKTPNGDTLYFDISLTDVEGDPNNGGGGFF